MNLFLHFENFVHVKIFRQGVGALNYDWWEFFVSSLAYFLLLWLCFFDIWNSTDSFNVALWLLSFNEMAFWNVFKVMAWNRYLRLNFTWSGSICYWNRWSLRFDLNGTRVLNFLDHSWLVQCILSVLLGKVNEFESCSKMFTDFCVHRIQNVFRIVRFGWGLSCSLLFFDWKWLKKIIFLLFFVFIGFNSQKVLKLI